MCDICTAGDSRIDELMKEYRFWIVEKKHPALTSHDFRTWLFLRLRGIQVTPKELHSNLIRSEAAS
ncbi:hypothetical protein LCGC14_0444330 [marine sediment metagenome]|uniref:Uncharacterized protein n=1 Tax=marine sediment metagenome TaxID=412755 RepID=A0A0F9SQE8_9ZZZZ